MKYTIYKDFKKINNPYNWKKGCQFCNKQFTEDEKFIRIDVQLTYMRGDDEVFCYHNKCFDKGIKQLEKDYKQELIQK